MADRIRERDLSALHQQHHRGCGNRLGDGRDQVHRIGARLGGTGLGGEAPYPLMQDDPAAPRTSREAEPHLPPPTSSLRSFAAVARPAADIPAASGATGFNCAIAVAAAPRIEISGIAAGTRLMPGCPVPHSPPRPSTGSPGRYSDT